MSYDPTNGIRLDELIYLVRVRLGDHVQEGYDTAEGDGTTDRFALTHTNLLEDSLTTTVDSVFDATATVDERSGWVSFSSIPADGSDIAFSYQYTVWSDERITEALNAAIEELFGRFYIEGNATLTTDGEAELLAEDADGNDLDPEDRITKVEYWTGDRWTRLDRWHVATVDEKKYIVFEVTPLTDIDLRVTYHQRLGQLSATSDTLETTVGLKDRAKEPLVLYACADLIIDRIHHRIRDDRGHNTQSENPVKSYEIQNDANYLRQLAELKAARLKQPTVGPRVVY